MITYRLPVLAMLFILSVGNPVGAQDHHEEKHHHKEQTQGSRGTDTGRSQEAHVHGIAELLVVLEGEQLDIELHSPAMNLLGFEHRARTAEQQTLVQNAKNALTDTNNLFTLGSAQCQLVDLNVDVSRMLDKSVHHDRHEEPGHSDIEARYRYHCERANTLDLLTTSISTAFPGIESLQVQWIANGRQGAATLTKNQHQIILK
jgi:hypothetical protein